MACPGIDEVPTHSATVVVRNDRARAIFLKEQDCKTIFKVRPSDATIAGTYPSPLPVPRGTVAPPCTAPWRSCSAFHRCDEAWGYFAFELGPGEGLSYVWPGTLHPIIDIAAVCKPDSQTMGCDQCIETHAAKPARYVVEADAWSEVPFCASPGACPCQRFSDGTCRHRIPSQPPTDLSAGSSLEFATTESVTVTFQ